MAKSRSTGGSATQQIVHLRGNLARRLQQGRVGSKSLKSSPRHSRTVKLMEEEETSGKKAQPAGQGKGKKGEERRGSARAA